MTSNNQRRVEILRYVIDRQRAKQRTTKAEVIRHMKGMSSRETTHGLIMELIEEGMLNVEKLNSQVHFLTVSEKFGLPQFERDLLLKMITETHLIFENVAPENEGLVVFLMQAIKNNNLREMINDSYRLSGGAEFDIKLKPKRKKS